MLCLFYGNKSELTRIENPDLCCKKYELAGIIRAGIVIRKYKDKPRVLFITENASLSRHLFSRVKELFKNSPDILYLKHGVSVPILYIAWSSPIYSVMK